MIDHNTIPDDVKSLFEKFASETIGRGYGRYSADAILHRIRWTMQIERGLRDYKCNDHWTSALARWFMDKHPEHSGFFELRKLPVRRGEVLEGQGRCPGP
jgi:hypothetical protein